MDLELIFLGTGTSAGVPIIGCSCAVCTSTDPRDQRTRPSVLIRYPGPVDTTTPEPMTRVANITESVPEFLVGKNERKTKQILIDSSPEMRLQMVRHRINHIDAVLYTHAHADHMFGIDDMRRFNAIMQAPIDIYCEAHTGNTLRSTFKYIFEPEKNINKSFIASLNMHLIEPGKALELHGATFTPVRLMHGNLPVVGYRIDFRGKSMAYCTDLSLMPEATFPLLEGLDVLVIDALRYLPHPTHLSIDQALEIIERLKPRRSFFTHIAHDVMHADLDPRLPEGVTIAYDGLIVTC